MVLIWHSHHWAFADTVLLELTWGFSTATIAGVVNWADLGLWQAAHAQHRAQHEAVTIGKCADLLARMESET